MNKNAQKSGVLLVGLMAISLLATAPVQAASSVSLKQAVRMQMHFAQENIQAEQRIALKDTTRGLDNPGVTVGPITIIETASVQTASAEQTDTIQENAVAEKPARVIVDAAVAKDILEKALRSPGVMGVSRIIAASALELAIEAAE